jgi:hypothetical protein
VRAQRETVLGVRMMHTLIYEVSPGSQVTLVVALPAQAPQGAPREAAVAQSLSATTLADSVVPTGDGRTTLRWREPDGTELQLTGKLSVAELETLRAQVRVPPGGQR